MSQTPERKTLMSRIGLTPRELLDVAGLSGILMLRLLGLFLLLPVLSRYALGLKGATPFLAGLAVGAYGLSQTVFQVPMGLLSDRWGRRPVIALGQLIYAGGCVISAVSGGIGGLLAGRLLQGCGATASVVIAHIADLTREEVRTRAMAVVGMSIGLSFIMGFVFGPILAAKWGVASLFWLIAALDVLALLYMGLFIPAPEHPHKGDVSWDHVQDVLKNRNLVSLDILMFLLHMGMTATFVVTPILLSRHWAKSEEWKVFLPMILLGGGLMLPAMAYAEIKKKLKGLIGSGIAVAALGYVLLGCSAFWQPLLAGGLIVYFIGFNFIEPALPSLVSRYAPYSLRGTSMGVFNMSQFLGAFFGGAIGGLMLGLHPHGLYFLLFALCLPWAWALRRLEDPKQIRSLQLSAQGPGLSEALRSLPGIYDARVLPDGRFEVRYSALSYDEERVRALVTEKSV